MNKLFSRTMVAAGLLACGISYAEAAPYFKGKESNPLSRMRKVETRSRWSGTETSGRQAATKSYRFRLEFFRHTDNQSYHTLPLHST